MGGALVVTLLTLLLGIQPVTTDLDLPALPTVQLQLGASVAAAQATLSVLPASISRAARPVQRHGEPARTVRLVIEPRLA